MKEIALKLPGENLIYLGDTAHLPYGEKSPEEIIRYTTENSKFLSEQKIKLLIIACHTASSHALKIVQNQIPIPTFGVIDPVIKELASLKEKSKIAILGTTSTIQSGIYQSLIQNLDGRIKIYPVACSLFVPLIEKELLHDESIFSIAKYYLDFLKKEEINVAILACTHYSLIRPILQKILGSRVTLIEAAKPVAVQVYEYLKFMNLLNTCRKAPSYEFYTTNLSEKFSHLTHLLFDHPIKNIKIKKD